jgi:purine-nucleoside phosphorylase
VIQVPTPHISAADGDFAEAVLLPGDPLRAKYIADNFFEDAVQVNAVRNMLGFTGTYQGMRVSVMGSGMGVPSISIYVTELMRFYGVKRLVRVGSAGGIADHVKMRDVVLASGGCTDSSVNRARYGGWDFAAVADFGLLRSAYDAAVAAGKNVHVGNVHTSDSFYNPVDTALATWDKMGVLAVEMETAALYAIAAEEGCRAMSVLTVSDHLKTHEATSSEERQSTFSDMVLIALDGLVRDAA